MRSVTARARAIRYDRAAMNHPTTSSDLRTLLGDGSPDAVPDFIWYELALKALEPETPQPTRLAALRLLARVPRSWDAVLMAALTATDLPVQLACVDALTAHVGLEPDRLGAFERLGDLPAWHDAARAAWEGNWKELAEAHEAARRERALRDLADRMAALEGENQDLREAGGALQQDLAASRRAEHEALERLEALEAASTAEAARLEAEAARLAREIASIHEGQAAERIMLVRAAQAADGARRRWSIATFVAASLALGPLALLAFGRGPVMATEPPAASRPVAAAPAVDVPRAHADGWGAAVVALGAEAERLEDEDRLYPALTAWQCAAKLAKDPDEVKRATVRADALLARIGMASPERRFAKRAAVPAQAAKPRPKPPAPKPAVRAAAPDPVPAAVRAKF